MYGAAIADERSNVRGDPDRSPVTSHCGWAFECVQRPGRLLLDFVGGRSNVRGDPAARYQPLRMHVQMRAATRAPATMGVRSRSGPAGRPLQPLLIPDRLRPARNGKCNDVTEYTHFRVALHKAVGLEVYASICFSWRPWILKPPTRTVCS